MKKLIFFLLVTFFLSGNAHSFLKNNTTAKLEECIFKSSDLISEYSKNDRCITKYADEIPLDSVGISRTVLKAWKTGNLFLSVHFVNMSTDYIITDLVVEFTHKVDYGNDRGVLHLVDNFRMNYFIEPSDGTENITQIHGLKCCKPDKNLISKKTTVGEDFEITLDNIKKMEKNGM